MTQKSKIIGVAAASVGLAFGAFTGRTLVRHAEAQTYQRQNVEGNGRYLLSLSNNGGAVYLLDTQTGRCWIRAELSVTSRKWNEIGPKLPR